MLLFAGLISKYLVTDKNTRKSWNRLCLIYFSSTNCIFSTEFGARSLIPLFRVITETLKFFNERNPSSTACDNVEKH